LGSHEELKARVCAAIDSQRERILAVADDILRHAELGYKEHRTAGVVAQAFTQLGLSHETGLALTGVKAWLPGGQAGPTVAIMGELDALPVPGHPYYNPETGAAHACGHFAQLGMMLAAAVGFVEAGVAPELAGRLVFFAVPAEESVEVEWRLQLREEGKIEFLGGKQELIRLGAFDDVDIAMLTHSSGRPETRKLALGGTNNGHLIKQAQFIGKQVHAGATPHLGVNALKAAMLALAGIDAQRETFLDDDSVRVHPIITKGGDVVNAVPADVRLETFVRGRRIEAIDDANRKVDRALRAGALAMGARVHLTTMPGYLPVIHDESFAEVYRENAVALVGADQVAQEGHRGSTSDSGDLSHVLPVIHATTGGCTGATHSADFLITDYELGIINPAKAMAMTAIDLLADGASLARACLADYRPRMTKDEYLAYMRKMHYTEEFGELDTPGLEKPLA
jgi:amidohydrolase